MDGRCRSHSEHRQSKGVCPFCLREKLAHLSTTSSSSSSSSSSATATTAASGCDSSNPHRKPLTLRKSRSLAFVFRKCKEEDKLAATKQIHELNDDGGKKLVIKDKNNNNNKQKSGSFWSALISGGSERSWKQKVDGDMLDSKTVKVKRAASSNMLMES